MKENQKVKVKSLEEKQKREKNQQIKLNLIKNKRGEKSNGEVMRKIKNSQGEESEGEKTNNGICKYCIATVVLLSSSIL
jgi:hypothetical protein